jgi:hypothetical protein
LTARDLGIVGKPPDLRIGARQMFGFFPNAAELFAENEQFRPYSPRNQGRGVSPP